MDTRVFVSKKTLKVESLVSSMREACLPQSRGPSLSATSKTRRRQIQSGPGVPGGVGVGSGRLHTGHAQWVDRQVGFGSRDESGSALRAPLQTRTSFVSLPSDGSPSERTPGWANPTLGSTAAMSSNSFAYSEQSGGGEATELGQEATSTISPSGAFGLFSSDMKK